MRLTDEMIQEDDKRFKRQNLLAEFNYCGKEVPKRNSITNDDIRFYAWLCRSAYALLKEQEALEKRLDDSGRINVVRCSECRYWNPPTYAEQEDGSTVGHCTAALDGQQTDAYWFCADGTR